MGPEGVGAARAASESGARPAGSGAAVASSFCCSFLSRRRVMAPAPGAPRRPRSLCKVVLATALGRQPSGPRVALLYRLPRGVGSGLQWPRPSTRRHRPCGGPLWRAPPTVRSHQPGSGKLWGTWELSGENLAVHGCGRDRTSGASMDLYAIWKESVNTHWMKLGNGRWLWWFVEMGAQ